MDNRSVAVFIGNLQYSVLPEYYVNFFKFLIENNNDVIILLGVSEVKGSKINPLSFELRKEMVRFHFPELIILPLNNTPTNPLWSNTIDKLLDDYTNSRIVIYGKRHTVLDCYNGRYQIAEMAKVDNKEFETSEKVLGDSSIDFRKGVFYAYNQTYPKVHPTVDIGLFKENKNYLLLGKKENDKRWRLPGGFVDPSDKCYEAAAARELKEECGGIDFSMLKYEYSFRINDWRYKNEMDKIITVLFSTDYLNGEVYPGDDIKELMWFKTTSLKEKIEKGFINPEHIPLIKHLIKSYL